MSHLVDERLTLLRRRLPPIRESLEQLERRDGPDLLVAVEDLLLDRVQLVGLGDGDQGGVVVGEGHAGTAHSGRISSSMFFGRRFVVTAFV